MVNHDRALRTEEISVGKRLIRGIEPVPTGEICPARMLQGGTVHQVIGAGIWAAETVPVLINEIDQAESAGVSGVRRCNSPGNRMHLTVWIGVVEMPEWPAIGEAPVARAHRHSAAVEVVEASQVAVFREAVVGVVVFLVAVVAAVAVAAGDDR